MLFESRDGVSPRGDRIGRAVTVALVLAVVAVTVTTVAVGPAMAASTMSGVSATDVEIGQSTTQTQTVTFTIDLASGETTTATIDTSTLPSGTSVTSVSAVRKTGGDTGSVTVDSFGYSSSSDQAEVGLSTGTDPGQVTIEVDLDVDTSGQSTEQSVSYSFSETNGDTDGGSVSFTLQDTTPPTYDGATTGDTVSGSSTARDKIVLSFTEAGTGIDDTTVDASDFSISGVTIQSASATAADAVTLTLGSELATDATPTVDIVGAISDSDSVTMPESISSGSNGASDGLKPEIQSSAYKDTDGDGTVDRVDLTYTEAITGSYDDGEWSIPTAGTVSLSKVGTGAVSSPTVQVDVAGTADTTGGSTAPQVQYSGSSITDTSGNTNPATSETVTVSDSAAPVETKVGYTDTSDDGTVDRIDVDYSEDVSTSTAETGDYSVGGTDAGSVSVDSAATSGSVVRLDVTTSLSSPALTLDYDATAGTADSITDGTNPAGSFSGVSVTDGVVPSLSAVETLDRDGDGNVDAATLTFSEAISDSSVTPSDYSIGGQAAEAIDTLSSTDDDTVQLRITTDANEVSGTDTKDVTYTAGGTTDAAGNALGSVASGDVAETDGAAPVITAFSLTANATSDELDVSFDASESLSSASVSISGPESATLTSFSTSGATYSASLSIWTNGDYTATLGTADDSAGNSASSVSDSATVSFVSSGSSSSSTLSGTSSRARVSGTTGLSEVGVQFGGSAAGTIRVTELSSVTGETPPGTFVSAVDISVPDSFTDTASTVKFAISRERLDDLGVEANAIAVYHRHDGSWERLVTRVVDTGGDTIIVEADTPGFSQFALMAGDEASTMTQATATATSTAGEEASTTDAETEDTGAANTETDSAEGTSQSADTADDGSTDGSSGAGTTASQTPGFGVGVVLVALLAFLVVGLRRQS